VTLPLTPVDRFASVSLRSADAAAGSELAVHSNNWSYSWLKSRYVNVNND
jgi:hypothetical protein